MSSLRNGHLWDLRAFHTCCDGITLRHVKHHKNVTWRHVTHCESDYETCETCYRRATVEEILQRLHPTSATDIVSFILFRSWR